MNRDKFISLPIISSFALFVFSIDFFFAFSNPNYAQQSINYTSVTYIDTVVDSTSTAISSTSILTNPGDFDLSFFMPFMAGFFFLADFINEIYSRGMPNKKAYNIFSILVLMGEIANLFVFVIKFHGQYEELLEGKVLSFKVLGLICVILMLIVSLVYRMMLLQNKKSMFGEMTEGDGSILLYSGLSFLGAAFLFQSAIEDTSLFEPGIMETGLIIYYVFGILSLLAGIFVLFYKKESKFKDKLQSYYAFILLLVNLIVFIIALILDPYEYSQSQRGWFTPYAFAFFFSSAILGAAHIFASPKSLLGRKGE